MRILKLGGSVLTDKKGYKKESKKNIARLAKAVAGIWRRGARDMVLIHGAGSFGHAVVMKHGLENGVKNTAQKLGFADTHAACSELSLMLVCALIENNVPAISIPPSAIATLKDKRIASFNAKIVNDYLEGGYLPVLYGDMVPDSVLGGFPCSGDQLVSYLGKGAELVVLATDVDGVLDDGGRIIPLINAANFADVSKHLKSTANDVTGGMEGKIRELLQLGTTAYIVNANHPERIEALFFGKAALCTKIAGR